MPAKVGIQNYLKTLDSCLRGHDAKGRFKTFCETINVVPRIMIDNFGKELKKISIFKLSAIIFADPYGSEYAVWSDVNA